MRYGSVCSGIEAATVAWHPLGWGPIFHSEIEPFPCDVLKHHNPNVPNLGDMTKFKEWDYAPGDIDLLVGGTPCQSFSVAGLRKGLDDPRGNLMLTFGAIAKRFRPAWVVWENVPGVLSSNNGRDFGTFLGMLAELGYGFAYRILDAQFFGVAQRRRRVFVVGHLGDWRRAAAVLFERESLCGNPPPSRKKGEGTSRGIEIGPSGGCFSDVNPTLDARAKDGPIRNQLAGACLDVARSLTRRYDSGDDGTGRGLELVCSMRESGQGYWTEDAIAGTIDANMGCSGHSNRPAVLAHGQGGAEIRAVAAFKPVQGAASRSIGYEEEKAPTLGSEAGGNTVPAVLPSMQVRRLTPRECERLQGFPDDYTLIPYRNKPAADGPRYKALGNSMAVPVMRWIGERIHLIESMEWSV